MLLKKGLEEKFINELILKQQAVSIYLKRNICLKGYILKHTKETVFLFKELTQSIEKNSISTIMPTSEEI